jgi:hypothetical protein
MHAFIGRLTGGPAKGAQELADWLSGAGSGGDRFVPPVGGHPGSPPGIAERWGWVRKGVPSDEVVPPHHVEGAPPEDALLEPWQQASRAAQAAPKKAAPPPAAGAAQAQARDAKDDSHPSGEGVGTARARRGPPSRARGRRRSGASRAQGGAHANGRQVAVACRGGAGLRGVELVCRGSCRADMRTGRDPRGCPAEGGGRRLRGRVGARRLDGGGVRRRRARHEAALTFCGPWCPCRYALPLCFAELRRTLVRGRHVFPECCLRDRACTASAPASRGGSRNQQLRAQFSC